MRLLALDTATPISAVALLEADRVVVADGRPGGRHSRALLELIAASLDAAGWPANSIEAVAVGLGPGSFTGVRIGLTVAKTLAFVRCLPLVGVCSLEALALNAAGADGRVCPALDALKGEVFAACYDVARLPPRVLSPPAARQPDDWAAELATAGEPCTLLGSGLERYRERFAAALGDRLRLPDEEAAHRLSAARIGELARDRLRSGAVADALRLEPLYCRLSEAELKHRP
jgi:tRNA threonylcarbamoyladenosine biosynthesis protein TsaB